jgi:metal-responsive CopG/Arc/MetJ family transcriptional regulator
MAGRKHYDAIIPISIKKEEVAEIEAIAASLGTNRTAFMRFAIRKHIKELRENQPA